MRSIIKIGKRRIGYTEPVFVIAEIGMNHNGNLDLAKKMIKAAADCGVDAVKFQTFKTEQLYSRNFPGYEERKMYELPYEWHATLKELTECSGLEFISTPFDKESVDFLDKLDISCFKVASSDLNNYPFLEYISQKGKAILLSTGFSTLGEIEKALNTIYSTGNRQVVLLHCISSYPASIVDLNLRVINTLRDTFDLQVGYSDHTKDSSIAPIVATALGACVIEKHFTISQTLPGYDHKMSETPSSLKQIVEYVRAAEQAMGSGIKKPVKPELERLQTARRSLYWKESYEAGRLIDESMFQVLRPGNGLPPEMLKTLIGYKLASSVSANSKIKMYHIDWKDE